MKLPANTVEKFSNLEESNFLVPSNKVYISKC